MYRYAAFVFFVFIGSSCFLQRKSAAQKADTAREDAPKKKARTRKPSPFQYGTPREEVLTAIKDRNELLIAEFSYPQGRLVAYQYKRYGKAGYQVAPYYLYFMNDTLIRKSSAEPGEREAKAAIKEYYGSRE